MLTGNPTASWSAAIRTAVRLLTFRAGRDELVNVTGKHLAFGLACTWIVGMGRYWDNPRVGLFQHLGVGSVVYVFLLALFLWLIVKPLRAKHWSYFRVLVFVSLVSPPAILYALPVENWYTLETANNLNEKFLLIVASWRVALLVFYLRRLGELEWFSVLIATLLPLTLIVVTLTILNLEKVVFDFMGGVTQRTADDASYQVLFLLSFASLHLLIPVVLFYVLVIFFKRRDARTKG